MIIYMFLCIVLYSKHSQMFTIQLLKLVTTKTKSPQTWTSIRPLSLSFIRTLRTHQQLPLLTASPKETGVGKICTVFRSKNHQRSAHSKCNTRISRSLHNNCSSGNCERVVMASSPAKSLETLTFVNTALKSLPIDEIEENYVRSVSGKT